MLKIAQIAPLYESVPPKLYGGTERVVAYLTDELVNQGHAVTLFASGDSITKANLIPVTPQSLRLSNVIDSLAYHILQLQEVAEKEKDFDLLHYHIDYLHFPLTSAKNSATLTTLHGRLDIPELKPLYQKFSHIPVVSISDAQRIHLPKANWIGTIHHGLPLNLYKKGEGKDGYVAFIGRISPEKGIGHAIEIAQKANLDIKIAAKIDKADREYYDHIKHLFNQPHVEFLGEINEDQKDIFLGDACALLFPIDWPEPFGMVMIEALACGTPVVAYNRGSVPEIITHGKTGYIVEDTSEAVTALRNIHLISRNECRLSFKERFSATVMAKKYIRLYEHLLYQRKEQLARLNSF